MPHFEVAGATDTGRVRKKNEDSFSISPGTAVLAVVADGIGGHVHGDIASKMCCAGLAEAFQECGKRDKESVTRAQKFLTGAVREVNEAIFERNVKEQNPLPMGCTVCAAIFADSFIAAANAGDSRLYMLEDGKLSQLTEDHTVKHNGINCLYLAVGITRTMTPQTFAFPSPENSRFLLMSDGVYNSLDEESIARILAASESAQEAADEIIRQANANGGGDNLTVIAAIKRS